MTTKEKRLKRNRRRYIVSAGLINVMILAIIGALLAPNEENIEMLDLHSTNEIATAADITQIHVCGTVLYDDQSESEIPVANCELAAETGNLIVVEASDGASTYIIVQRHPKEGETALEWRTILNVMIGLFAVVALAANVAFYSVYRHSKDRIEQS